MHLHPTYTVTAMHKGIELASLAEKFPELSRYTNEIQMLVKLHRSVRS